MPPETQMTLDGVEPDAVSYCQALRACRDGARGDGRAAEAAAGLVEGMAREGLGPDVAAFEILARYLHVVEKRNMWLFCYV